jgi:hypothetical protein
MLRYVLTEDDVGSVRFGISPLCELGLSLRAIREPARFPLQLGWLRRTEDARTRLDLPTLSGLIDERMWTPDFLNPVRRRRSRASTTSSPGCSQRRPTSSVAT